MKRTDRMLGILLELQGKGTRRAEDLAETFQVSRRSIYRDIDALCGAGVPVMAIPGRGYSLMDGYFLPPLSFTVDEATMLLAGGDAVAQNFDETFGAAARTATEKIAAVLPPALRADVDDLLASIRFVRTDPHADPAALARLRTVRQAIVARRTLRFHYHAKDAHDSAPRHTVRQADPYAIVNVDGAWYMHGYCHLRGALRNFRLSRMSELATTDQTFVRPAGFRPRKSQRPTNTITARVAFDHSIEQWVRESSFYQLERFEDSPDGPVAVLATDNIADLVPWILGWGSRAHVLEPRELADRVAGEAAAIAASYATRSRR